METTDPIIYMPTNEEDYIHILEEKIKALEITIQKHIEKSNKQQETINIIMQRLDKLEEYDDDSGNEGDDEKGTVSDLTTDEEECTEETEDEDTKVIRNKLKYEQLRQALFKRKQQNEECVIM